MGEDDPAPADHSGYQCGECPPGFTGNGKVCIDVNECLQDGMCNQTCVNTPGSYVCSCSSGYTLNEDAFACDDVDECLGLPCHTYCSNILGGFECSCEQNFILSSDLINCVPEFACGAPNPCDADHGVCSLVSDTPVCSCLKGYNLNADSSCIERDECYLSLDNCDHSCVNTAGAFTCGCDSGYELADDNFNCHDMNECMKGAYTCMDTQVCVNTEGNYTCGCMSSQTLDENGVCKTVSFDDPVVKITDPVAPEAEQNAVEFTLDGVTVQEYTVAMETRVFTIIADSLNNVCNISSCDTVDVGARRKRNIGGVAIHKDYLARLPGYPIANGNDGIDMAVYYQVPGAILESSQLRLAVVVAGVEITNTLGLTILSAELAYIPTPGIVQTVAPVSGGSTLYIIIGAVIGTFVLITIVVVVIVMLNKKKSGKLHPETGTPSMHSLSSGTKTQYPQPRQQQTQAASQPSQPPPPYTVNPASGVQPAPPPYSNTQLQPQYGAISAVNSDEGVTPTDDQLYREVEVGAAPQPTQPLVIPIIAVPDDDGSSPNGMRICVIPPTPLPPDHDSDDDDIEYAKSCQAYQLSVTNKYTKNNTP